MFPHDRRVRARLGRELLERADEASQRVLDLSTAEDAPAYMIDLSTEAREHDGFPPYDIGGMLARRGLWVRTTVRFDPPLGSDPNHPGDPTDPLLVIRTVPLPGQYFPYVRASNPWQTWHVSLCFRSETHAYNEEDLGYLVRKFDNRDLRIQFSRISTYITSGDLDRQNDSIASDHVVQRIHAASYYGAVKHKPLHISF
jgi:hypothetical protein